MLEDIQNLTLFFDVDFTVLVNDSTIFDNSSAPSISFMVSTVPEATRFCCDGYYMGYNPTRCLDICGDGRVFEQ